MMPNQMVPVSESAFKTLHKMVVTSGMEPERIIEMAIEQFSRQNADPRFTSHANAAGAAPPAFQPSSTAGRIVKSPGVCGGRACIRGTRITVWGLDAYKRQGLSDAEILRAVQGLT